MHRTFIESLVAEITSANPGITRMLDTDILRRIITRAIEYGVDLNLKDLETTRVQVATLSEEVTFLKQKLYECKQDNFGQPKDD